MELVEAEIERHFDAIIERRLAQLEQSVTETVANRERDQVQRLELSMTSAATRFGNGIMNLHNLGDRIKALESKSE